MRLEVVDYETIHHESEEKMDPNAISVSYDGGRLEIYVNHELIFKNYSCGNSFQVDLFDLT
jgi:hypothetical protein